MKIKHMVLLLLMSAVFLGACTTEKAAENVPSNDVTINPASTPEGFVSDADAVKNALNVGSTMPSFSLKDIGGKIVNSDDLLEKNNLVIVFYRGAWCPFCNLYLRNLQQNAAQIKEAGGDIVAISVENPDNSSSVARKNELQFAVLSDPKLEVARKFGIVYQLPKETDET